MRLRFLFLAFCLHFLFIVSISCRDVLWLVAHKLTVLPTAFSSVAEQRKTFASAVLGQAGVSSNPIRRALLTYFHLVGIERGYGYFAPNVPGSYRLMLELHYADGRIENELPAVNSDAAGLRIASLLDEIGRTRSDEAREYMVKGIARVVWREHVDVTKMRAIFGLNRLPSLAEFEQGKRESSYEWLYAYDFSLAEKR